MKDLVSEGFANVVKPYIDNEITTRSKLGAKNFLKPNITSGTTQGVTYTVNNDGSITLNGTCAAWTNIKLDYVAGKKNIPSGSYILNGSIEENNKFRLNVFIDSSKVAESQNGNEASFTVAAGATEVYTRFEMDSGQTYNNETFYPMIRLATDADTTYQPYAKTNQELTAENQTLTNNLSDEVETRATLGAHNLLPNNAITKVENGVTFTVNSNGSITVSTVSGGATADTQCIIGDSPVGMYHLSGCPSGGSNNTYCLYVGAQYLYETGEGLDVNFTASRTVMIIIRSGTIITTPITFYPMIRLTSDTAPTYQPYAMTNRELTDNLANSYVFKGMKTQTITADGVKTYKELIEELRDAVNSYVTSLGSDYYIITRAIEIWTIQYIAVLPKLTRGLYDCRYMAFYFDGANTAYIRECYPSTTTNSFLKQLIFTTSPTIIINDMSSSVPSNGATIIANFEVYKKV